MTGPLAGIRVVELASLWGAWAGKVLADLGADVIVVEPPGGHFTRTFGPFVDDDPHPDRSLWWWYYNTSKRAVALDLASEAGATGFRRLVGAADVVIEGERPGTLAARRLDYADFRQARPELLWTSVTSHGRASERSNEPWTDLTMAAASGIAWLNGYDDHSLPPMRGRGHQTLQIAGTHAALATLTALVQRDATGAGQLVDVSAFAACNVTTESGTFVWLVARQTAQRQTGRHAAVQPTMEVQVQAGDGTYVTTGFLAHEVKDFQVLLDWLDELGLRQSCPEVFFLEMGIERGGIDLGREYGEPEAMAILGATRTAMVHIAQHISAADFFEGAQRRDLQVGIIFAPDEAYENAHFVTRGFQVSVHHDELGRDIRYPGAPFKMPASPWEIRLRPPLVGEHTEALDGAGWPDA
jgi:crotonobetainyl-CoA:carnitine CoA-transferase CaiB-like acyl-CoA transferase